MHKYLAYDAVHKMERFAVKALYAMITVHMNLHRMKGDDMTYRDYMALVTNKFDDYFDIPKIAKKPKVLEYLFARIADTTYRNHGSYHLQWVAAFTVADICHDARIYMETGKIEVPAVRPVMFDIVEATGSDTTMFTEPLQMIQRLAEPFLASDMEITPENLARSITRGSFPFMGQFIAPFRAKVIMQKMDERYLFSNGVEVRSMVELELYETYDMEPLDPDTPFDDDGCAMMKPVG